MESEPVYRPDESAEIEKHTPPKRIHLDNDQLQVRILGDRISFAERIFRFRKYPIVSLFPEILYNIQIVYKIFRPTFLS